MPELPEVETSRRGIAPHLTNQKITAVIIREKRLRWPIPDEIENLVEQTILDVKRRAKYLLIETAAGTAILHLGMSGKLRVLEKNTPVIKHDHVDIVLSSGKCLRFNDPRRFGALFWTTEAPETHPLLRKLGPEPFNQAFTAERLFELSRGRSMSIKQFIMDNKIVAGVGNIYANESLFLAGINPKRAAGKISQSRYKKLYPIIKTVLATAIEKGGTTLKDFTQVDGKPGYFAQQLNVYGRAGKPCMVCKKPLSEIRQGQRTTVYCKQCQK